MKSETWINLALMSLIFTIIAMSIAQLTIQHMPTLAIIAILGLTAIFGFSFIGIYSDDTEQVKP